MTAPTPPRGTQTTLRALPRALVVGRVGTAVLPIVRGLEAEGYLATAVPSADEALARLRDEEFAVAIVAAELSGGPAAFVQALRSDEASAQLPLLIAAREQDPVDIEQWLSLGADDVLPAGFGPGLFHVRLSAALDRRRVQDGDSLRREMAVARNIQRDFLPESLPTLRGLELDAALHPARQVSGDFYDAFPLAPSGNLMLVVGDVCDKGVGAALFMALFRSLIRASADPVGGGAIQMIGGRRTLVMQSLESATPADLLTRVAGFTNNYIARLHGRTNMFATVFLAVLEPAYGELVYVNAGHEPAMVIAADGGIDELRPTGPALGMMPDVPFTAVQRRLETGQTLFAFTDGLVEARSPSGEVYGAEQLRALLRSQAEASAAERIGGVLAALKGFARQAEPHDDLTMLAVRRV